MKILLVNTAKKSTYAKYVPLALLKLSTKHKQLGDEVDFVTAGSCPKKEYDILYFSTVFLFSAKKDVGFIKAYAKKYPIARIVIGGIAVTLIPEYYRKYSPKHVEIVEGLVPELDTYVPDYAIADCSYSFGFTSRGCPNKCPWCVVPKIEGKQYIIKDWKKAIDHRYKTFMGMDNNILSCDIGHIEEVFSYMHEHDIKVDFNQAMDCQLLMKSQEIQNLFIKYKKIWHNIRFAWDSKKCNESAIETLDFFQKEKIRPGNSFVWYMLYDYKESPEDVYNRIKKILFHKYSSGIKLMRYKDLTTGGLTRHWGEVGDRWAVWTVSTITGIISKCTIDKWLVEKDFETFNKRRDVLCDITSKYGQREKEAITALRLKILDT